MEANLVDDSDNVDDSPELASDNRMCLQLSSPDQQATEEKRKYLKKEN